MQRYSYNYNLCLYLWMPSKMFTIGLAYEAVSENLLLFSYFRVYSIS